MSVVTSTAIAPSRPVMALAFLMLALLSASCGIGDDEQSAVRVSGQGCRSDILGQGMSLGGGVIVTSGHVVDGVQEVLVRSTGDDPVTAYVAHIDRDLDVAVLVDRAQWFNGDDRQVVEQDLRRLANDRTRWSTPNAEDEGTVVLRDVEGGLESRTFTVVRRIRANTENVGRTAEVTRPTLELNASIDQGDSGAVLVAADGSMAGAIWAVSRNRPDVAFAVQGNELPGVLLDAADRPSGPGSC